MLNSGKSKRQEARVHSCFVPSCLPAFLAFYVLLWFSICFYGCYVPAKNIYIGIHIKYIKMYTKTVLPKNHLIILFDDWKYLICVCVCMCARWWKKLGVLQSLNLLFQVNIYIVLINNTTKVKNICWFEIYICIYNFKFFCIISKFDYFFYYFIKNSTYHTLN